MNLLSEAVKMGNAAAAQLEAWLDAHRSDLTRELGQALEQEAARATDRPTILGALRAATRIYLRLGLDHEKCRSGLRHLEVLVLNAQTPPHLDNIIMNAMEIHDQARKFKDDTLAFDAAVLIADAAHRMALVENDQNRLLTSLQALCRAIHSLRPGKHDLLRFALVTSRVAEKVSEHVWVEEKQDIDAKLRELAVTVRTSVPNHLVIKGDLEETVWMAALLARMCAEYGEYKHACERLAWAMNHAGEYLAIWLIAAETRYEIGRQFGGDPEQWKDAARAIRPAYEQFREEYWSRAGRLWSASYANHLLHMILQDETRSPAIDLGSLFSAVEALKSRLLLDLMNCESHPWPTEELRKQARVHEQDTLMFPPDKSSWGELRLLSVKPLSDRVTQKRMRSIEDVFHHYGAGLHYGGEVADLQKVRQALQPDEAIIEYFISGDRNDPKSHLLILFIDNAGIHLTRQALQNLPVARDAGWIAIDHAEPVEFNRLNQLVLQARRQGIGREHEIRAQGDMKFLYDFLVRPALARAQPKLKRVILIPSGALHALPFAALEDENGRALIERFSIVLAPSASVWAHLRSQTLAPLTSGIGIGDPLDNLPSARKEVLDQKALLKNLEFSTLVGPQATAKSLYKKIEGQGLVHIAAHGEFPEADPLDFHRIRLAPDAGHDGRLTADEVRQLKLSKTHLVTLSICDGGLVRFGHGDEPFGLVPAFLSAGASNVIGPLWPCDDRVTRDFMKLFYNALSAEGPAEALQQACKTFIADGIHSRHWAGFVLVGSGRPIPRTSKAKHSLKH